MKRICILVKSNCIGIFKLGKVNILKEGREAAQWDLGVQDS